MKSSDNRHFRRGNTGMLRVLAFAIAIAWNGFAFSNPPIPVPAVSGQKPHAYTEATAQKANHDQRGTESIPLVVKTLIPEKSQEQTAKEAEEQERKASFEWWGISSTVVIAFFTVVLAFSTVLLWRDTRGLRKLAYQQSIDMKESLRIAALQTRASVAALIPKVALNSWKLALEPIDGNPGIDPVPSGIPPINSQPVFCFSNTGPTSIVLSYYASKWQISSELTGEPYFGGMSSSGLVLEAGASHCIVSSERIKYTTDELKGVKKGTLRLWAYGFIIYHDFLDERHQIGVCMKWDNERGFVLIDRENYSYQKHQNNYTKSPS